MARLKIKKGDRVAVIAGKDRGKKGKVLRVLPDSNRVVVEGAAKIKKHTRPTQKVQQGGIIEREGAIDVSNVKLICPNCGEPTRAGRRRKPDGVIVRMCRKCGKDIDKA